MLSALETQTIVSLIEQQRWTRDIERRSIFPQLNISRTPEKASSG
ncbi:hypothetical protein VCHA34P126_140047 [Vibrio chagasii]|nr:hypothetical protein VCHA34P126_140047 [Vibrio chagasii]CAH7037982.1 hypothetical protein VCHA41O247_160131 [Vibrio chagasii]CAH7246414.1 hypothetical protein VCHA50P420_160083 [Vibrio chagasii]